MSLFVDIHVIQSVPFANLNRDDTGAPKSATFGGTPRIRVSSQAWKRPTGKMIETLIANAANGDEAIRTTQYAEHLAEILVARGVNDADAEHMSRVAMKFKDKEFTLAKAKGAASDADDSAADTADGSEGNGGAKASGGRVLMYLTKSQYTDIADYAIAHQADLLAAVWNKKDQAAFKEHRAAIESIIIEPRGLIRLFGRMLAELPTANTDSAIQIAHALTVHTAVPESDYLLAVDDLRTQGAGGIFPVDYASGTFYRYATISVDTLVHNGLTQAEAATLVGYAIEAFVIALPTGKQSASAAQVRPDFVSVQVRERPANLVNAFEEPLWAGQGGYGSKAVTALAEHASVLADAFGEKPFFAGHTLGIKAPEGRDGSPVDLSPLGSAMSLRDLITAAQQSI